MPASEEALRNDLVAEVADSFHAYIGKGISIPGPSSLDNEIATPMPSLDVDGLDEVLRVHFLLSGLDHTTFDEENPGVIPFMRELPDRVRRLDADIQTEQEVSRGGIDGRVDWQATTQMYRNQGYVDRTQYVTIREQDELMITANRVLRELLLRLQSVFEKELATAVSEPDSFRWLDPWLQADSGEAFKPVLDRTLERHPVMRALGRRERQQPATMNSLSLREIRSVKRTRKPIYREAAHLLERYRRVVDHRDFSESEARAVLRDAYIRPDTEKGSDLFELYWIFSLIEALGDATLRPVRDGTNKIASWKDVESSYEMYHTSTRDQLSFSVTLAAVADELRTEDNELEGYLPRMFAAEEDASAYAKTAFDISPNQKIWSGTPDILLFKRDRATDDLQKVLIGEVKYSSDMSYLKRGLRELLEYVYLCSDSDGEYLLGNPYQAEEIDDRIEAVLFTQQVSHEVNDESLPISIVEHGSNYTPFTDTETV